MKYRKDGRLCIQCGKPLPSNRQKFCSHECVAQRDHNKWRALNPLRGKTSATTGAISELRVAVDLLAKGYDVFRALSPSCPCDLAVLKNGNLLRVEVRTVSISSSGRPYLTKNKTDDQNNIDVYAWVLPDKIIYNSKLE